MKIQETAKNGVKINIDTPLGGWSSNGLKTKPKIHTIVYRNIPSGAPKLVDKQAVDNYHELDRLAKDWIELLLNGI